jgi:hypothetical protein
MCIIKQDLNLAKEISHKYAGQGFDSIVCQSIKALREVVKQLQERNAAMDIAILDSSLEISDNLDVPKFLKYHFPDLKLIFHKNGTFSDTNFPAVKQDSKPEKPTEVLGSLKEWKQEVRELNTKFKIENVRKDVRKLQEERRRKEANRRYKLTNGDTFQTKILPVLLQLNDTPYKPSRKLIWKQVLFFLKKYRVNMTISDLRSFLRSEKKVG